MAACVRIYTRLGKEHCKTVDSFTLHTEHVVGGTDGTSDTSFVRFHDRDAEGYNTDAAQDIDHIVEAGQPCNIHIRYKDDQVEAVCTLDGVQLNDTGRLVCNKPKLDIIGYVEDE